MKLTDKAGTILTALDLGIVPVNTTQKYTYYLVNDSEAELTEIVGKVGHQEVLIEQFPKTLAPKGQGEVILSWTPKLQIKQGLKTQIDISAIELWR